MVPRQEDYRGPEDPTSVMASEDGEAKGEANYCLA